MVPRGYVAGFMFGGLLSVLTDGWKQTKSYLQCNDYTGSSLTTRLPITLAHSDVHLRRSWT